MLRIPQSGYIEISTTADVQYVVELSDSVLFQQGTIVGGANVRIDASTAVTFVDSVLIHNDSGGDATVTVSISQTVSLPIFVITLAAGETLRYSSIRGWHTQDADGGAKLDPPDHGALPGLEGDDHIQYHDDIRGDARYYQKSEHINTSTGVSDAGKPVVLDAAGRLAATMRVALTGDVTASAGSASTTIADNAVTLAKMADMNSDRLIGRDTAASGDPEEITVGGGLEFTGSGGIQRSELTGDVTASAGSGATTIASDVVSNTKLADMAANTIKGNATGSTTDPADIAIGTNTVLGRVAGNIVAASIVDAQITAATVTLAKIANAAANSKLLGSGDAGSGASYVELTLGTNLSMSGTTLNASGGGGVASSTTEVLTGTDSAKFNTPDSLAALWEKGGDISSSGTISIGEGGFFHITGTTTITDIDFGTDKTGRKAWLDFEDALILTHNGTTLILPTGANITTAANDVACFVSEGADAVRCVSYMRADGTSLVDADTGITQLTGDVTAGPGSGSQAATIADEAVTLAKMQHLTTNRLMGRDTTGTGDVEQITVGGGIEFTGSTGIQRSALTGDVTASAGSNTTTIAADSVTMDKLQDIATDTFLGRVTAATGTVEVLTNAQAKTALDLTGTNSGDQTITLTGDVTGSGTGSFAATIASDSVTYDKMQDTSGTDVLLGRSTSGAGTVEEISCTAFGRSILDDVDGPAVRTTIGAGTGDGTVTSVGGTGPISSSGGDTPDISLDTDGVTNVHLAEMAANTIKGNATGSTTDAADIAIGTNSVLGRVAGNIVAAQLATAQVADEAITLAKMAHMATASLLGRDTAATGDVEVLDAGTARGILNVADGANNYSHPNHSGHVTSTGDGATVLVVASITGQTDLPSGLAGTDELLVSDAGVIKRMDVSVMNAYFDANLDFAATSHGHTVSDISDLTNGIEDLTTGEVNQLENIGATTITAGNWTALALLAGTNTGDETASSTTEVLTGTDSAKLNTPDSLAALWEKGGDVTSGATISFGEGGFFHITGTTTITDIDFGTDKAGRTVWARFADALILTHNGTTLILPTGANITTAANDVACFVSEGADNVRCVAYMRADGSPLVDADTGITELTGDVTAGPGDGAQAATIADEAVTFAKMQHIATDRLIGRDTAATGDPEEISVGGGLEFTAAAGIQRSALTGDVTASAGSNSTTIAANVVSNTKLADMAANTVKANATGSTADPADLAVGTNTVVGRVAGNIVAAPLATGQIANNAVTIGKMQQIATDSFLGRDTAATGDVEVLSAATARSVLNVADGANNYSHPNHSGQVTSTGDGATVVTVSAITAQSDLPSGLAGTDELLVSDGGVIKRMDVSVMNAYFDANLDFAATSHNHTVSEISDLTNGIEDLTTGEVNQLENIGATTITAGNWTALALLAGTNTGDQAESSTTEVLTGTDAAKVNTPNSLAALWEKGGDITSGATISIGEGGFFHVTGTTTITDIDFAVDKTGRTACLLFEDVLLLTHNGTTLILPTGASITTAAGDTAWFTSEGSDNIKCTAYYRADGTPLVDADTGITQLTGDVTAGPGSGSQAATIADEAVTLAKMQHIDTDRLLGRDTAATGDVEELTVGGGVEFTGSGGIQRSALTGDVTASAGSASTTIAPDSVTMDKIQDIGTDTFLGRVTAATGTVEVLTNAQAKTALDLTGTNSGDQTITLTGDVTGSGTGSFAATIADEAVTLAKMAHMATASLLGRDTASTGDVEVLDATTARGVLNVADGANNYSHPNHSGQVTSTGDGATVVTASAITAQTDLPSGLASTDELLVSDAGVIKRMDVSVLTAHLDVTLSFSTLTANDHELNPAASEGSDDFDTTIDITATPKGMVEIFVNGIKYVLGQGSKLNDFYFTNDGGVSARPIGDIAAADELYFNPNVAGFNLATSDVIDLVYEA